MTDQDTHDHGATYRDWTELVVRLRLGRTVKAVALGLARFADADGRRIFPGLGRLAADLELTYNVVQAAVAKLSRLGLIEQVQAPSRHRRATVWRLILHPDLLDRIEVPTPAQHALASERLAEGKRRRPKVTQAHPSARAVPDAPTERPSPHGVGSRFESTTHGSVRRLPTPCPTTYQDRPQLPPTKEVIDVRTAVTVSGARGRDGNPDFDEGVMDVPKLTVIEGTGNPAEPAQARGLWPAAVDDGGERKRGMPAREPWKKSTEAEDALAELRKKLAENRHKQRRQENVRTGGRAGLPPDPLARLAALVESLTGSVEPVWATG